MTIDFDSLTALIFMALYAGVVVFLRVKKKKTWTYLFFLTFFYIYLVETVRYTQFPIYLSKYMREAIGQTVWTNMNFIPILTLTYQSLKTSLLNVILFIPFGFGLPFISRFRMKQTIIRSMIFSAMLEALQLIIALAAGFTFRIVDINDIIFNTLGGIIGYILFVGFVRAVHFALVKWRIEQNAVLRYIYERPQVRKSMQV